MKVRFYAMPRQMGKTTTVAKNFLKCAKDGTILIVANRRTKREILEKDVRLKEYEKQILYATSFDIRGKTFKHVIIDEWLFFTNKNKMKIYNDLLTMAPLIEDVEIYTTPNKLYNKDIVDNYRYRMLIGEEPYPLSGADKEIAYNFLGHPETEIFNTVRFPSLSDGKMMRLFELLSTNHYRMEVLGHLFL